MWLHPDPNLLPSCGERYLLYCKFVYMHCDKRLSVKFSIQEIFAPQMKTRPLVTSFESLS